MVSASDSSIRLFLPPPSSLFRPLPPPPWIPLCYKDFRRSRKYILVLISAFTANDHHPPTCSSSLARPSCFPHIYLRGPWLYNQPFCPYSKIPGSFPRSRSLGIHPSQSFSLQGIQVSQVRTP